MHLEQLQDYLRRKPFKPFRIFVSDGATFDVRHPELCMAGWSSVFVGMPSQDSQEPVFERHALVDLSHITRLESIDMAKSAAS